MNLGPDAPFAIESINIAILKEKEIVKRWKRDESFSWGILDNLYFVRIDVDCSRSLVVDERIKNLERLFAWQ